MAAAWLPPVAAAGGETKGCPSLAWSRTVRPFRGMGIAVEPCIWLIDPFAELYEPSLNDGSGEDSSSDSGRRAELSSRLSCLTRGFLLILGCRCGTFRSSGDPSQSKRVTSSNQLADLRPLRRLLLHSAR